MKKIFLSLAALLTFGIASAQISPSQPTQTQPDPATTKSDPNVKPIKNTNVKNDVANPTAPPQGNEVQPRKDELKTRDHVKSTKSATTLSSDSTATRKQSMKPKRKS